jgi:hypothetical protein
MQVDNKGGITCKHGDEECAGNLVQLCVGRHTPPDHNFDWFYRFLTCSWDSGLPVSSPELVTTCLDKVGANPLIRQQVARRAGALGATDAGSCSVADANQLHLRPD